MMRAVQTKSIPENDIALLLGTTKVEVMTCGAVIIYTFFLVRHDSTVMSERMWISSNLNKKCAGALLRHMRLNASGVKQILSRYELEIDFP
jgi:hypothetical protein